MRTSPTDAGYTLIELLVAMLLLGIVGIAIAGGMQFGTRVWERSEHGISTTDTVDEAQAVLRTFLSSATPHMAGGFASLHGEPNALQFDGEAPQALGVSGLAHFELTLSSGSEGTRLSLRVTSLTDSRAIREATLADQLGDVQFAYFDASEKVPAWLGFWRDRERLPDAVRLASDRTSGATPWPALVVRLPIAQDANCIFDTVSISCRKT